jgi:XapX domain-containing protein
LPGSGELVGADGAQDRVTREGPMSREALLGILVALVIGGVVRALRLPIPAPPSVAGALMVLGLTLGYLVVDHFLRR